MFFITHAILFTMLSQILLVSTMKSTISVKPAQRAVSCLLFTLETFNIQSQ